MLLKKTGDNHKITFFNHTINKKRTTKEINGLYKKNVQSLIAGYVITLLMLGLLTYLMRKFILDEKAVDNIILEYMWREALPVRCLVHG